jgi:hypothetical protein
MCSQNLPHLPLMGHSCPSLTQPYGCKALKSLRRPPWHMPCHLSREEKARHMQTVIHIYCTSGPSIRVAISRDARLEDYSFEVGKAQQPGRAPGWLKLYSTEADRHGALNVQWDSATAVLKCRVVNRGEGKPNLIIGDFLDYILARYRKRVRVITILPE